MTAPRPDLPAWRSLLFVPVVREKFVANAHTRGADGIILDLEDSVPEAEKDRARGLVVAAAKEVSKSGADVLVRINRPWHQAFLDIEAVVGPGVMALMCPKVESPEHLGVIAELLDTVGSGSRAAGGPYAGSSPWSRRRTPISACARSPRRRRGSSVCRWAPRTSRWRSAWSQSARPSRRPSRR